MAALTRTVRGLVPEVELTSHDDGVPSDCVVNFDNLHTLAREESRGRVVERGPSRMSQACERLRDATGC